MSDALTVLKSSLSDRYEVEREIGAGGMATVYLARDKRHDRPVALKVLNPELGAVLGVERFLSEIRVTANLQHPNLLPLFDSGEAGGLLFYVMPFVEGETLRAKLHREKQLPIEEALRITIAVADALDYAHGHHVIHRDLKPENILLQHGQPVVADFGIALAVSNAGGNRITQTGLSLGTPQYMSPEQATGDRVIDGRSDIYSLGAVAYEMLTGDPPHTGSTAQAVIAHVLMDKPRSIRSLRPAVPEYVEEAIEHALEKLPADRYSTAHEFSQALQGRSAGSHATTVSRRSKTAPTGWRQRVRDPLVLALGVIAVLSAATIPVLVNRAIRQPAEPVIRYILTPADSIRPWSNFPWPAAISPDGGAVVFTGVAQDGSSALYLSRSDQLEPHAIPGTAGGAQPLFSPDGQWLEFEQTGFERKVRLDGSAPLTVSSGGSANGADWTTRDEIVLGSSGHNHGLSIVSAAGGEVVEITRVDSAAGDHDHLWPLATPDGRGAAFTIWRGTLNNSQLAFADLRSGEVTKLGVKGIRPLAFLEDCLIYVQADGAVMAVPFSISRKKTTGPAVPVLDPVGVVAGLNGNSSIFVSRGGALVTARGGNSGQIVWIGRDGSVRPVSSEVRGFFWPRLSPDGKRIAVTAGDAQTSDIWIYDTGTGTLSRISASASAFGASWMADGRRVVYAAVRDDGRTAIVMQDADGGSAPVTLAIPEHGPTYVTISRDGKSLLWSAYQNNSFDLFWARTDSANVVHAYLDTGADENSGSFSPDGRWVAMTSNETGQNEVYVRSFPDPSARVQISVGGGGEPVWSRDGTRVYYRARSRLMEARLATGAQLHVLSRDTVANSPTAATPSVGLNSNYDVSADGSRFLGLLPSTNRFQIVVVPNWLTELRARLRANTRR